MAKSKKKAAKKKPIQKKGYAITQSLLKSLYEYREGGECGLLFKAKFLDGRWDEFPASEAQKLGTWFEYELTGSAPKDGQIPLPEKTLKGEYKSQYKNLLKHIDSFKKLQAYYKIELVEVGTTWSDFVEINGQKVPVAGTLDLLCKAKMDIVQDGKLIVKKGELFIGDIKTTGLLDDGFSAFGWRLDYLHEKIKLILQPIHYKMLSVLKHGKELPFLFFLFSTKDVNDVRIINFEIDEGTLDEHKAFIENSAKWVEYYMKKGWTAHPTVARCNSCPLKVGCEHFAAVPPIQTFYYGSSMNT